MRNCNPYNNSSDYNIKTLPRYEPNFNTSELYRTLNLPQRFEKSGKFFFPNFQSILKNNLFVYIFIVSDMFKGYGIQRSNLNPMYRTNNLEYGWFTPCAHTVPQRYVY